MSQEVRFLSPFVVFEGNEYTGKTSVATETVRLLREKGHDVVHTREPGGTPFGELLRSELIKKREPGQELALETHILLHQAYRKEHIDKVIRPALLAGKIVVCERFMLSTLALNVFPYMEENQDLYDLFMQTIPTVLANIPEPLTILLHLEEADRLARGAGRVKDAYESASEVQLEKIREAYEQFQNSPSAITFNAANTVENLALAAVAHIETQLEQLQKGNSEFEEAFAQSEVGTEVEPGFVSPAQSTEEATEVFDLEATIEGFLAENITPALFHQNIDAVDIYLPLARTYMLSLWNRAPDPALFKGANLMRIRRELHSRMVYGYECDLLRQATLLTPTPTPEQA
jgi:dTMP kinase